MGTVPGRRPPFLGSRGRRYVRAAVLGILLTLPAAGPPARADEVPAEARVPARLGYVHGEVFFWRSGADAWAPAQLNTPLAAGDTLHVAEEGGLEIQIGPRAFLRVAAGTTIALDREAPDFLQFRLASGHVSLDLVEVGPGQTVELATPGAVATIEQAGYYRAVVADEETTFIARRGGRATLTAATGVAAAVASDTQLVVTGEDTPSLATAAAPERDAWDHWNDERTRAVVTAASGQYVAPGIYGVEDLDRHGTWRVEPEYGPVWVPTAVGPDWAPYSTGRWIWDPYYGWTWVDAAPWGWAPYHYGRWVYVRGRWAWAPGPVVARPVYAPALVAFFGIGVRGPLGWCALGWGEPLLPWWGRPGFIGTPWWAGWAGPRVVNRVVVHTSVRVKAEHVRVFQNVRVKNAVVVVDRDRFGHGPVRRARVRDRELRALRPVRGDLAIRPRPASRVAAPGPARRPPDRLLERRPAPSRDVAIPPLRRRPDTDTGRQTRPVGIERHGPRPAPDGERRDRGGQRGSARSSPEQPRRRPEPADVLPQVRGGRPVPATPAPRPPRTVAPPSSPRRLETPDRQRGGRPPGMRQQRPAGARQPGPATRTPRAGAPAHRQR